MENLFEYTSLVRLEKVLPLVYPGVIDYLIKLIYRIFEYEPNQVEKFILLLKKKDIGGNTG